MLHVGTQSESVVTHPSRTTKRRAKSLCRFLRTVLSTQTSRSHLHRLVSLSTDLKRATSILIHLSCNLSWLITLKNICNAAETFKVKAADRPWNDAGSGGGEEQARNIKKPVLHTYRSCLFGCASVFAPLIHPSRL